jgi:hypothetical protein
MASRLVAIFAAVILGIATGWMGGLALHQLVNPAPPASPHDSASTPAAVQSPPNDPGPGISDKPDVIIAIPNHGGDNRERYRYLSLGQIIKGIEGIRHQKKKHHEGKGHDDKD